MSPFSACSRRPSATGSTGCGTSWKGRCCKNQGRWRAEI